MRIVAFTKTSAIGPSSRVRYYAFVEPLREHGIDVSISPLFGRGWFAILRVPFRPARVVLQFGYTLWCFARRAWALATLGEIDGIVIEHQLFPYLSAFAERRLRRAGRRFTIEFDDAIYLTWRHGEKMAELCRIADRVIVGNRFLAEWASARGARVSVIPTTIDLDRYPEAPPERTKDPSRPWIIGWIGLPYNFAALESIAGPLRKLATEQPLEVRVVSAGAPAIEGVPIRAIPWTAEDEVARIAEFDVGVMPLSDDEWSRGKCAYKILQYFACGVPVVASPVGVNADVVRDGENGLLARSPGAWYEALSRLRADFELCRELAARGRMTVERDFSKNAWTPKLAQAWREAFHPPQEPN